MNTATNQVSVKLKAKPAKQDFKRITCAHCKRRFMPTRVNQVYCKTKGKAKSKCQLAAAHQRQNNSLTKRLFRAQGSAFFYWVAQQCIRSGTIQILEGHTVETMVELFNLYKDSIRLNGTESTERLYVLSHIYAANPASSSEGIGALFANNLIIVPAIDNQRHSNYFKEGTGVSIPRSNLSYKYAVEESETTKSVISRIVEFLGKDLVAQTVVKGKIQPIARIKLFAWFEANGIKAPSEKLSTQALQSLKAEHLGKDAGGFKYKMNASTPNEVYLHELSRLGADNVAIQFMQWLCWMKHVEVEHEVLAKVHNVCFSFLHQMIPDVTLHLTHYLRDYVTLSDLDIMVVEQTEIENAPF